MWPGGTGRAREAAALSRRVCGGCPMRGRWVCLCVWCVRWVLGLVCVGGSGLRPVHRFVAGSRVWWPCLYASVGHGLPAAYAPLRVSVACGWKRPADSAFYRVRGVRPADSSSLARWPGESALASTLLQPFRASLPKSAEYTSISLRGCRPRPQLRWSLFWLGANRSQVST